MNIGYLDSIIELYLRKEKNNHRTNLSIKKKDDKIEFNFNMKFDDPEKTSFSLPIDIVSSHFQTFLNMYKEDLLIIDEKYDYNNADNTCYYYVEFKNGRVLSFNGFSILEINNIRNILYNIKMHIEELRVNPKEEKEMAYKPRLAIAQAGFASYFTIFLITLFFVDIFVLALWVCKLFIK